jgi:hypothetical protein
LIGVTQRTRLLAGIGDQAFVNIDSLLRPLYGHAKQGASFGHAKIAGKAVLRRGLSALVTRILHPRGGTGVVAGIWLNASRADSGKGAASMVAEGVNTAGPVGATRVLCGGDSACGNQCGDHRRSESRRPVLFPADPQPAVDRAQGPLSGNDSGKAGQTSRLHATNTTITPK